MPTHPLVVLTYIMRHGLTLADEQVPHDQSIQPVPQLAAPRDPVNLFMRCLWIVRSHPKYYTRTEKVYTFIRVFISIIGQIGRCRIYPLCWYDLVYDEEDIINCMYGIPSSGSFDFRRWVQRTVGYIFLYSSIVSSFLVIEFNFNSFEYILYDIYHPPASRTNARIMHVMTLVGHGVDEFGSPYWIVKNIYGPNWGYSGFARIERSADNPIVAIDLMLRNVEDMFRFIPWSFFFSFILINFVIAYI